MLNRSVRWKRIYDAYQFVCHPTRILIYTMHSFAHARLSDMPHLIALQNKAIRAANFIELAIPSNLYSRYLFLGFFLGFSNLQFLVCLEVSDRFSGF